MDLSFLTVDEALFKFVNEGLDSIVLDFILIPFRNPLFWVPVFIFLIAYFFYNYGKQGYWLLVFSVLTVGSTDIVSSRIIKPLVERPRPCHDDSGVLPLVKVRCGSGYSFTSSHATNHFGLSTFWFLTIGLAFVKWRWLFVWWAVLICIAQVYVGVHYPLDVLCGGLLGFLIGRFWAWIYHRYYGKTIFMKTV